MELAPKVPIPEQAPVIEKVPEVPMTGLETLWLQIGGTLCNLACTHCFISCHPKNDTIPFMTLEQTRWRLEESKRLNVKDYYITGGEVFLNPEIFEILEAILEYGPCTILTNGLLLTPKRVERLVEIQNKAAHEMHFRVSLDSLDEKENDAIRGENCFRLALQGMANLSKAGFSTHLTMVRSWDDEEDAIWEKKALAFMKEHHVPEPQVKFLPGFLMGELARTERGYHENERVTEKCFENYPITNLQCSSSRMATSQGVYVCPILVEEPSAKMGDTLEETMRPFPLGHPACYTCRISGMTCKS
ncbi:Radical SAM domain protein [Nitrospina gracilis 3/211]|uniref:Radical SAM domain protein n=1 Tax=Nitrospina gracilis (strain 3/211) TaxID=1266370 RepID=M1ZEA3_NITG3|nr:MULTISPECIES: radical SAM protein [Nitrospina]MCF8722458.1 MoaA/NifB/PqqE/SkfB family radical SAM enzyme [Nitrospina sp. Nb-3]CCQ91884.1 Radical SAM domain protein [Nitrospina gracilis 3/211]